jgi:hypothetical protein
MQALRQPLLRARGGAAAAAAIMSALQQSAICGLEERKSLIAARPAKDIAPRHKARRTG